jgi:hypothetical protein
MSKLNFVHSFDLTSSTLMPFLLSVQVLSRIEKILSTYALLMGIERLFAQHRTVIMFTMRNVAISQNKIESSSINRQQMSLTSKLLK